MDTSNLVPSSDGDRGSTEPLAASGLDDRRAMQSGLAGGMILLAALTCGGLAVRELARDGPYEVPAWGSAACLVVALWSRWRGGPTRAMLLLFLCLLVSLVTVAAFRLRGAAASALCFSFIPGFVAVLLLGPAWGWLICGLMLVGLGGLFVSTPHLQPFDLLRFIDEVAMTVWATALAHALERSFGVYEATIARSRSALVLLRDQRRAMAQAVYEQLEPLSTELQQRFALAAGEDFDRASSLSCLQRMTQQLRRAKTLARLEQGARPQLERDDRVIRRRTMRLWLRLGAGFIAFIALRNFALGFAFAPSVGSLVFCLLFDFWLSRQASLRFLESTALVIGVAASGPMILLIASYGGGADAPLLVVTPGTVLFTALLSQGPAAWAIVVLNCGILAWAGLAQPLTAFESRLLGDLVAAFFAIMLMLRRVFRLRRNYARTMLEQTDTVALALRQHRRLAGTLFHDVSNQLQSLTFHLELEEAPELDLLRSLAQRVRGLIELSKEFLLGQGPAQPTALASFGLDEALGALAEAFGPRLSAKGTRLEGSHGTELRVLAQPELLVESVLGNLLSNAIKFSPPGSTITWRAEAAGSEVRIALSDQGPGIPVSVSRDLENDAALPSSLGTAGEAGQGYGLQLAREHVARMGGRLDLRNLAEGGTEASVWLPRG